MSAAARVHGAQRVHRALVEAFSFPGRRVSLADADLGLPPRRHVPSAVAAACYTLLDGETRVAAAPDAAGQEIARMTGAVLAPVGEAAFLVVTDPTIDPTPLIAAASVGTLVAPHRGATVVVAVEAASPTGDADAPDADAASSDAAVASTATPVVRKLQLRGPGIASTTTIIVTAVGEWLAARNDRVAEFPMGIDLILIDRDAGIIALPRTTRIREVAAWAM